VPDIRAYRPSDRAALYDICVRTADAGGDARGQYSTDELMGDLFAGPYAYLEPGLAFVLTDEAGRDGAGRDGAGRDEAGRDEGGHAVGYVVGTADTAAFARRYAAEWIPLLDGKYEVPPPPPRTAEQDMVALHLHPERMVVPELAAYPAHLHIDLLPDYQGRGFGRRLIDRFRAAAAEAGAPAVHLGMVTANVRARGFYDRLGFEVLPVTDPGPITYLGRSTT
jgi:ribosomal protein S18 acetylase RimI-like enzyme